MFVAIRDIRFAKGRFTLMGSVVALITLLIVLLSGLTAGLASDSTAAIRNLPADHIVFGTADASSELSFTESSVNRDQLRIWSRAEGVRRVAPLGIGRTTLDTSSGTTGVVVFGAPPGSKIAPPGSGAGLVVVSAALADELGLHRGATVTVGTTELTVAGFADNASYAHTPVVWTSLDTWQTLPPAPTPEDAGNIVASVLAADITNAADVTAIDAAAGTTTVTTSASLSAISGFSSENKSLLAMQGFLYAISALVIGAFLTVWTIQRTGDVAILKALGSSTRYLLRDALAQALVVLLAGAGVGAAIGVGIGAFIVGTIPFTLTVGTTVVPLAVMIVLGMAGAVLATRRITSVDPLTALGAAR